MQANNQTQQDGKEKIITELTAAISTLLAANKIKPEEKAKTIPPYHLCQKEFFSDALGLWSYTYALAPNPDFVTFALNHADTDFIVQSQSVFADRYIFSNSKVMEVGCCPNHPAIKHQCQPVYLAAMAAPVSNQGAVSKNDWLKEENNELFAAMTSKCFLPYTNNSPAQTVLAPNVFIVSPGARTAFNQYLPHVDLEDLKKKFSCWHLSS